MPFVSSRPLADMLDEDAPGRAARRITDAGGDRLKLNTRRNTPIDTSPFRDKPGRPRGALRASIHRSRIERYVSSRGSGFRVRVLTEDPAGPHVEWPTRPHWITPRRPGGALRWRDQESGDVRFAKRVWHPGTNGVHMFALGAAKTEAQLGEIAAPALALFRRELSPPRVASGINRAGLL